MLNSSSQRERPKPSVVLILAACMIGLVAMASWFAATQSIWVDETTQLSGLTLSPWRQVGWLAGWEKQSFGVPDDRMPPLSYWVGWLWSRGFGLSESSLRWMGIACVGLGVPGVWLAARRLAGDMAAMAASALFVLSPNVLEIAGEIRAYPLFLMLGCWTCWAFVQLESAADEPHRRRWAAVLAVLTVLAAYTHFFGVVLAGSVWGAAVVTRLARRRGPWLELVAGAASGIACTGVAPFVVAAKAISSGGGPVAAAGPVEHVKDLARLLYRLVGHPASKVHLVGLAALLAGVALLAICVFVRMAGRWRRPAEGDDEIPSDVAEVGLAVVAALGVAAPTAAAFLVSSFDALQPSYSCWLLPVVVVLLASGVTAAASRWERFASCAAVVLAIAGSTVGASTLLQHRTLYSHGPSEWLAAIVEQSPAPVAVIHDGAGSWGFIYFPLEYQFGDHVEHWLIGPGEEVQRIRPGGLEQVALRPGDVPWKGATQIWVRATQLDSADLKGYALGTTLGPVQQSEDQSSDTEATTDASAQLNGGIVKFRPPGEPKVFTSYIQATVWVDDKSH